MSNEAEVERMIVDAGKTAPRVTPQMLDEEIVGEYCFTALDGIDGRYMGGPEAQGCSHANTLRLLTFCVLVLRNGFTVTGESACASPENYDPEIGRKIARDNARQKVWPLLGFRLRDKLAA